MLHVMQCVTRVYMLISAALLITALQQQQSWVDACTLGRLLHIAAALGLLLTTISNC
jgi:hypothetical protein